MLHADQETDPSSVARIVREYESRLARLDQEKEAEKLRRTSESSRRMEKEAECVKVPFFLRELLLCCE